MRITKYGSHPLGRRVPVLVGRRTIQQVPGGGRLRRRLPDPEIHRTAGPVPGRHDPRHPRRGGPGDRNLCHNPDKTAGDPDRRVPGLPLPGGEEPGFPIPDETQEDDRLQPGRGRGRGDGVGPPRGRVPAG